VVRDNARWKLTDLQRLLLALTVAAAIFLLAMAAGMRSFAVLLIAVALLVLVGVSVVLLGLRYNSGPSGSGTAYVITASDPPGSGRIVGTCQMTVLLDMPGAPAGQVKLLDKSVPTAKWPRTGDILPVDIDPRTHKPRVRWERANLAQGRAQAARTAAAASPTSGASPTPTPPPATADTPSDARRFSGPTPPVPGYREEHSPTPPVDYVEERSPTPPGPPFKEVYSPTPHTPPERRRPRPPAPATPTPAAAPTPTPAAAPTPTPAAAATPTPAAAPPGPRTAPDDLPTDRPDAPDKPTLPTRQVPEPRAEATSEPAASLGVMLLIADLTRSVEFYRDVVGFTLVDSTPIMAVLTYGGARVVLQEQQQMPPVDRRVVYLQLEVPDVRARFKALRAKGVAFTREPAETGRSDRLTVWTATFRDPDGHAIALTEWRDR
jgi:predicted enzyme related to lactoylglutathione lyase